MLSITNTNLLTILFREIIAYDSGIYKKYINTGALCGKKKTIFLMFKWW